MSLDGFLGDTSDDEVRHRKSSSHRVQPGRRKPEKVGYSEFCQWSTQLFFVAVFVFAVQHFQKGLLVSTGTLR